MAEEETGFTFVDKRRITPDAAPQTAETVTVKADTTADFSEERAEQYSAEQYGAEQYGTDAAADAAPTTYDMIGYCINLLASQAWQKLGLLADPQTGEAQPDLPEAKIAIDVVGDLAARLDSAPETAIPADLRRELRTLVNDLRLNYVSQRGGAS